MKNKNWIILAITATFFLGFSFKNFISNPTEIGQPQNDKKMKLGAFSISLSVKDLKNSKEFYENLGFAVFAGSMEQNYLIMKNENALVGLFQGMFEGNILTFNPGWDENAKNIEPFDDVRDIQKNLRSKGIKLTAEADENTKGPASIMTADPDGNVLLIDQHR
jgi:catechol 2,3-dioxygenase-like lactoylglutathione lyase family enzyme